MEAITVTQTFSEKAGGGVKVGFTITEAPCHAEITHFMWDELGGAEGAEWLDRNTVMLGTVPGERVTYRLIGVSIDSRCYIVERIADERDRPMPDVPETHDGDAHPRT